MPGKIIHLEEVDSTNLYALKNFESLEDGVLVIAKCQTAGRGRRGRKWHSPPRGNIYATYLVKEIRLPLHCYSWIGCLAALDSLRNFAPHQDFWLKWPNDVCTGEPVEEGIRKIAGVLCETHSPPGNNSFDGVAVGVGINLNMRREDIEGGEFKIPPSSLFMLTGYRCDPAEFAEVFLAKLRASSSLDESELHSSWMRYDKLVGRRIKISREADVKGMEGAYSGISSDGSLILRLQYGDEKIFHSGDVSLLVS